MLFFSNREGTFEVTEDCRLSYSDVDMITTNTLEAGENNTERHRCETLEDAAGLKREAQYFTEVMQEDGKVSSTKDPESLLASSSLWELHAGRSIYLQI